MKLRTLTFGALALALPFTAIACSDDKDSSGDYSESEIVEKLTDAGLSEDLAKCVAPELKDADIDLDMSPEELMKSDAGKAYADAAQKCAGEVTGVDIPDVTGDESPTADTAG